MLKLSFLLLLLLFIGCGSTIYAADLIPGTTSSIPETIAPPPSPNKTGWEEAARDGRYIKYANGVVLDSLTNLEWYAGPDKYTNWGEAKKWVEGLTIAGGGWRLPGIGELRSLFQYGVGSRNMTPLLETTGYWFWSGDVNDCIVGAKGMNFQDAFDTCYYRKVFNDGFRAFAVRPHQ